MYFFFIFIFIYLFIYLISKNFSYCMSNMHILNNEEYTEKYNLFTILCFLNFFII